MVFFEYFFFEAFKLGLLVLYTWFVYNNLFTHTKKQSINMYFVIDCIFGIHQSNIQLIIFVWYTSLSVSFLFLFCSFLVFYLWCCAFIDRCCDLLTDTFDFEQINRLMYNFAVWRIKTEFKIRNIHKFYTNKRYGNIVTKIKQQETVELILQQMNVENGRIFHLNNLQLQSINRCKV